MPGLSRYRKPRRKKQNARKPSNRVSGNKGTYRVEAILDKRLTNDGQQMYLVKWLGFPHYQSTWVPIENLHNAQDVLALFEETYQPDDNNSKGLYPSPTKTDVPDSTTTLHDTDEASRGQFEREAFHVDILQECPPGKLPHEILGAVNISGIMIYLVRWVSRMPGIGGVVHDTKLIEADVVKIAFPQLVISFFEKHIVWDNNSGLLNKEIIETTRMLSKRRK